MTIETTTDTTLDLVVCDSDLGDGGWSLHAPGSTDNDIAEGIALPLVTGTGPITDAHRAVAWAMLSEG